MKIFCVEDTLVATARIGKLQSQRLLVVRDRSGGKQVAVDPVGCKPGDWVIAAGSSAAREAAGHKDYPSDLTIVGIIDYWDEPIPEAKRVAGSGDGNGKEGPAKSGDDKERAAKSGDGKERAARSGDGKARR
ncbi:MAG: carboxysome peptide A [Actinobacteria bacterium]|nr:carboxysome peptide A [Actinomycetota bacterium]